MSRSADRWNVRWPRQFLAVLFVLASAAAASACPLCYGAAKQLLTIGLQLDMAEQAVLAQPLPDGSYRMVEVIKGSGRAGDFIAGKLPALDAVPRTSSAPLLLLRDAGAPNWTSIGTISTAYATWLRQLLATRSIEGKRPRPVWPQTIQTSFDLSEAGWRQRVALVLPYLEDANPLAAEIAWGELARAPYATLDVARSRVDPRQIVAWLDDRSLAPRRAAYILLLGFAGGADEAAGIERRLDAARASHDTTDIAAMLAADLELRGQSRVSLIEENYFKDRSRTLPEIEAALFALNVLGDTDRTIPRARVIAAYQVFIRERGPMAGFVAPQLANWGYWGFVSAYVDLLKSNAIKDPASQFAVASYLQQAALAITGVQ
jgi:hypothetical protein